MLWQFVLVTDNDAESEGLQKSIYYSTADDKYVLRYSVRQIWTGVHLLQTPLYCRKADRELHGVKTVHLFRLLFIFSIPKSVSKLRFAFYWDLFRT
jgi:hypothetical protein